MKSHRPPPLPRSRRARGFVAAFLGSVLASVAALTAATSAQALETGTWYVLESRHSGLVFDVNGTSNGAQLLQENRTDAADQQFRFVDAGGGYYTIESRNSGKMLDVYAKNPDNGADIVQWTANGGANQQWQITESGGFATIVNRFSGKALDVWERSTTAGTRISQYTPNGGTNQQWRLIPVTGDDSGGGHTEELDRAPVAVNVNGGVYLGWRLLAGDPASTTFNVYRDGQLITTTDDTNLTDSGGGSGSTYEIGVVQGGQETERTAEFGVWGEQYLEIDMDRPAGGTTPDGVAYTYSPNDGTVADLDGDGSYEWIQKWDPSNSKDNSNNGHTGNVYIDAYTLSGQRLWRIDLGVNIRAGAHYTSLIAYDLDSDGKAEIALKTGDGTRDGVGNVIGNASADHRNSSGRILTGPEYLTVFDGQTGAALDTVAFGPARGDMCDWGDCYGNRGDRLMASVAFLDGNSPSLVTSRGIYEKIGINAWDWNGSGLSSRWSFDSGDHSAEYRGQGNHQMSIADVDSDGRDEIVFGAMTIDDNGAPLNSSGLGHGDALHVSDFDGDGDLDIFSPFECMSCSGGIGAAMRDAATGQVQWSMPADSDVGRGACGDIDPNFAGAECWAVTADGRWDSHQGQLRAADGTLIGTSIPSANHMIWWDADLGREILDHEFNEPDYVPVYPYIAEWNPTTNSQSEIFAPSGVHSNNGTKGNPALTADLFGDWREEVVWRKSDNTGVRIFTTVDQTEHRLTTLMQDRQYRLAVTWQNESYNQPPWPSYFVGWGM